MNRIVNRLGFTGLLLAAGPVLMSQSQTTGAITGLVRDGAGKTIEGASVRVTSAQINRTVMTDTNGLYRFPLLNPGDWKVEISKAGMQTVSFNVNVTPNSTSTVNATIKLITTATVEVFATNTTVVGVDTTVTTTGKTLNSDVIAMLPSARSMNSLAYFAPGAVSSGWSDNPAIGGGSATENQYIVDGLNTTDQKYGFQGASLPKEFVEQTSVMTGGYDPEFSALGGVINVITKQGTNQFAGSLLYNRNLPNAEALGKYDPNQGQVKPAIPMQRQELLATAGGAIMKDKLFYFVGIDYVKTSIDNSKYTPSVFGVTRVGIEPTDTNAYFKLNWYIATDHQLTGVLNQRRQKSGDKIYQSNWGPRDFSSTTKTDADTYNFSYDWNINSTMFLSAKYGRATFKSALVANTNLAGVIDQLWWNIGPGAANVPAGVTNKRTQFYNYGGYGGGRTTTESQQDQFKIDFNWILGDHSLKMGYTTTKPSFDTDTSTGEPGGWRTITIRANLPSTGAATFRGISKQNYTNVGHTSSKNMGLYIQDSWEVSPGLKVKYGFRYEAQEIFTATGQSFLKFNKLGDGLQPRLGIIWDPDNKGTQKFMFSYAKYFETIPQQPAMRSGGTETYVNYHWSPARATYNVTTGAWTTNGAPDGIPGIDGGLPIRNFSDPLVTPQVQGIKLPQRNEFILGYERILANGLKLGANLRWRRLTDPIEDVVPMDSHGNFIDPYVQANMGHGSGSWSPILANIKMGQTYHWISQYDGKPVTWVNDIYPTAYNDYKAMELTAEKKTERWFFSGSYTWSRLYGTYEGLASSSNGQADANITASYDYPYYVGTGLLPLDRTHVFKGQGIYTLPLTAAQQLQFGGAFSAQSGARTTIFTGGDDLDWGYYDGETKLDGKYSGGKQLPWLIQVDTTIKYSYKFGKKTTLSTSLDIFNIFNKRQDTRIQGLKTYSAYYPDDYPYYGKVNAWQAGRRMEFSLGLTF